MRRPDLSFAGAAAQPRPAAGGGDRGTAPTPRSGRQRLADLACARGRHSPNQSLMSWYWAVSPALAMIASAPAPGVGPNMVKPVTLFPFVSRQVLAPAVSPGQPNTLSTPTSL